MAFVLASDPYLDEASERTRNKPVLWEGYQRAGLVSAEDVALLKKIDRQPRARVEIILLAEGQSYARLYLGLLKKLVRLDTIQWILVMIGDALVEHDERIALFTESAASDPELPYGPLLKLIEQTDEFTQLKSLQILAVFLAAEKAPLPAHLLTPFIAAVSKTLLPNTSTSASGSAGSQNAREVGVKCLEALLPRREVRAAVWAEDSIINSLASILRSSASPQTNYQVAFCFWLLSFDEDIAQTINKKYDVIPVLAKVAKNAVKEKVIRVIVATFRNLATNAPAENLPAMLIAEGGLLPFIKNLTTRKWSDEEIPDDLAFLKEELTKSFESLSTYDEYVTELSSGHLSWSPVHESESFWKENASKLSEKEYEQLRVLVNLLKTSEEPLVLAVAAHDLGQYVKYAEGGKRAVDSLQGKTRVMELMTHADPDVRFQALLTVQRLVSHAWAP